MRIHFSAGTTIQQAVYQLLGARRGDESVVGTFNEIELTATKDTLPEDILKQFYSEMKRRSEEYLKSPQYAIDRERDEKRLASMQLLYSVKMNELTRWTVDGWRNLEKILDWFVAIQPATDHVGIRVDSGLIVSLFLEHGYLPDVNTGKDFLEEDKENYARYIIGQCLGCLETFGAVHQVTHSFVEKWKKKFEEKSSLPVDRRPGFHSFQPEDNVNLVGPVFHMPSDDICKWCGKEKSRH